MVSSSPSINHGPPFDITECLPENDGPPLSALAEGKSFAFIHPVNLNSLQSARPKTVLWEAIERWVDCKEMSETLKVIERSRKEREKQERERAIQERERAIQERERAIQERETRRQLLQDSRRRSCALEGSDMIDAISRLQRLELEIEMLGLKTERVMLEQETERLEQETQTLKMILSWIGYGGKNALKHAEYNLEKRCIKPTDIKQHIEQLLELMEQEYLHTLPQTSCIVRSSMSVSLRVNEGLGVFRVFKEIREEMPKLIEMDGNFGLRYFTLEAQLSNALDKILRLSSWTPSSTHNKCLRELLGYALLMLKELGGNKEYHDDLRDFMKRHTAFCVFTLKNAQAISAEDSETTAELCRNLRLLAQNLGKIASTKAEQYQTLYEIVIPYKKDLSHWIDSASPGQGRSLVDGFTDSLKDMASTMRREANFWHSQSNQFHIWRNIRETYGCDINAMPPFPSEQLERELNDHRISTTPSIHGSVTQNPEPQRVPQATQRVSATFADLQKLRVNATQAFLVKSENSISKRMRETRGYLESVVDVAEKQLSEPSEGYSTKVIVRLAEKALCIAKRWNKLQRKVKYWGSILSIFSKPFACQTFDMASGISRDDFLSRVIATPDTLIHPYLIEFELCLRDMWHHFLSSAHFWARIDLDPATFTSSVSLS